MNVVIVLLVLALLAVVIAVIAAPLRASLDRPAVRAAADRSPRRAELEAARESKYREIRDADLDFRTGKLSADDYAAIDSALRAEALAILDQLEALDDETESSTPRDA
jgi:Na+-transporting methylmalonyl-CoA/oxaloacetate decarboxylase gamma subunit